jgi:hypothetical protein
MQAAVPADASDSSEPQPAEFSPPLDPADLPYVPYKVDEALKPYERVLAVPPPLNRAPPTAPSPVRWAAAEAAAAEAAAAEAAAAEAAAAGAAAAGAAGASTAAEEAQARAAVAIPMVVIGDAVGEDSEIPIGELVQVNDATASAAADATVELSYRYTRACAAVKVDPDAAATQLGAHGSIRRGFTGCAPRALAVLPVLEAEGVLQSVRQAPCRRARDAVAVQASSTGQQPAGQPRSRRQRTLEASRDACNRRPRRRPLARTLRSAAGGCVQARDRWARAHREMARARSETGVSRAAAGAGRRVHAE